MLFGLIEIEERLGKIHYKFNNRIESLEFKLAITTEKTGNNLSCKADIKPKLTCFQKRIKLFKKFKEDYKKPKFCRNNTTKD